MNINPRSGVIPAAATVLVVAAAALGLVAWRSSGGSGRAAPRPALPLAPISSLGALSPAPDPGPLGPEDVPIPAAPPLARANAPAPSGNVDGISAAAAEQLAFHIHAHLTVFVAGAPRQIPFGVGIAPPLWSRRRTRVIRKTRTARPTPIKPIAPREPEARSAPSRPG